MHAQIDIAGTVYNHALALQKRYYRLTGKYISLGVMDKHIAKLRMKRKPYVFWKQVGSQAVQDALARLDDGYMRFFQHLAKRPPKYKKVRRRKSFTLKQAGWKLLGGNKIQISGRVYKFVKHREMLGTPKTVIIKRDAAGRLWLFFRVVEKIAVPSAVTPVKMAGFDFGLKAFLTDHTGKEYLSGLHFRHNLRRLRVLQSRKDKKPHRTNNRRKAAWLISRTSIRIADKRRDDQFKLAHDVCDQFDVLCLEDLNIQAMKALWGRKVSDLAFYQFVSILKYVAAKRGKVVQQIDRCERTTGKCSRCGHIQDMELRERTFHCHKCGLVMGRDHNSGINIRDAGASAYTGLGIGKSRPQMRAVLLDARSPRL